MSGSRIAVLGAGIMGVSLALFLARRGREVVLFDRREVPLACASRWNEGKIHLGYLYGADHSLGTARHVIPGGLAFGRLASDLVGCDIRGAVTAKDDLYLVHRRSVIDSHALQAQFNAVSSLVREHSDARTYLTDVSAAKPRPLTSAECAMLTDSEEIVAAFEVPERSVDTQWLADRLVAAVGAEPRILLRTGLTVEAARPENGLGGRWRVLGQPDFDDPFDVVVNALWEGRLAVDMTAGLAPEPGWSHRYRLSVFARTAQPLAVRSAIVAVGPFGDIKNYDGRSFYASWYPAGLVAEGEDISPPEPKPLEPLREQQLISAIRDSLARLIPSTAEIFAAATELKVRGGFVFAQGRGSIGDPLSTLHRRDRFGVRRIGNYFSVDTGKYSTAPWLAERLAREICGR